MSVTLDKNIEQILSKLEAYKISHPTLYTVWKEYIEVQKTTMENSLIQCNNAMKKMDKLQDCDLNTIRILYNIMQIQQST